MSSLEISFSKKIQNKCSYYSVNHMQTLNNGPVGNIYKKPKDVKSNKILICAVLEESLMLSDCFYYYNIKI